MWEYAFLGWDTNAHGAEKRFFVKSAATEYRGKTALEALNAAGRDNWEVVGALNTAFASGPDVNATLLKKLLPS